MTQDTDTLILKLGQTVETWRLRVQSISTDPNVLHWQKVKIESFASVIKDLGLSAMELSQARNNYPRLVQEVLQQINLLLNDLNNLKSDIRLGPLPPDIAQATAQKIEGKCKELKPDLDKLFAYQDTLIESSSTLKEKLNFYSFLPQARQQADPKTKALFKAGYVIYMTVSDPADIEQDETIKNMFRYLHKVTKIQETFKGTEIPPMPAMVSSFLESQLDLCLESCSEVKHFINFVSDYFQSEMNHVKDFQKDLDILKTQPLTELLLEIPSQTEATSKCLQRFTHKKFLMDYFTQTSELLVCIETFHRILELNLIPYLQAQIKKENSLLNPHTLASARSSKYFSGFRGLWRFIRMLFSANISALISKEDLEKKMVEAINTCSFFYKQGELKSATINTFIDKFYGDFKRPFPQDELISTTKRCIVAYATILEEVYTKFKQPQLDTGDSQPVAMATLGVLSREIVTRTDKLRKYRQKFE